MHQRDIPPPPSSSLSPRQARVALALAEAIIPGNGASILGADEQTLYEAEKMLEHISPHIPAAWGRAQLALDSAAVLRTGRRFHKLSRQRQQELLASWHQDPVMRVPLNLVSMIYKLAHFDRRKVYETMGGKLNVVEQMEQPRWLSQATRGEDWVGEDDIEAEVIVVGTGAGGAVVGRELAEKGLAVVFVEEGELVRRNRFDGSSRNAHENFYRGAFSLGNSPMPVFMGRLVGGSTAVNGGTCFRTPPWVLDEWCEELNTEEFSAQRMEPYFDKVEEILEVAPSPRKYIGPIADIIARGSDKMGWSHFAIRRNAPGCEGTGFCDFGCRTDARKSTNLSYIPPALERGSMLVSELSADRIIIENGKAAGVLCKTRSGRTVRMRAPAVIFAGGAVPTPAFLLRHGLCNQSGQVGRNLSLHPSAGISAQFTDQIKGYSRIPQGYGMNEFLPEGILVTAAQPDLNYQAIVLPIAGEPLMRRLENADHLATFGVLIKDSSRGRVRLGPGNTPIISYQLNAQDTALLQKGMAATARMCLEAGAPMAWTATSPETELRNGDDVKKWSEKKISAGNLLLTSYHPLGTCRMGRDPHTSVVDFNHQTHEIPGLFLVDGSTVPGPTSVNPQITIMAMATRAAERIADVLS